MKYIIQILLLYSTLISCSNNSTNNSLNNQNDKIDTNGINDSTANRAKQVSNCKPVNNFNANVPLPNMYDTCLKSHKQYKKVTDFNPNVPLPDMYESSPIQSVSSRKSKKQ